MLDKELCGELVARCFQARTDTHVAHLLTDSYAAHKALQKFYEGIIDLVDAFAEGCQGRAGKLVYPAIPPHKKPSDCCGNVEALRSWIDEYRDDCTDIKELQAQIDEIQTLCNSTVYKLKGLK